MKQILFILAINYFFVTGVYAQYQKINTTIRECPSFSMHDINNNELSLVTLKDKIIVINIIGYKNIQPAETIQQFIDISKGFSKEEAAFIALTGDTNQDIIDIKKQFKESNYHLVIKGHEEFKEIVLLFNKFPAIPLNFIINKSGKIVYSKYAHFTEEEFIDYKNRLFELKE